ncbi:MAG TPA: tRNA lysidine(34) synthetase TilS [Vicinamibacterales bacterium]|nr:tRNA lysidine(34) synthetase TilS [Vicinamibacterales bacterium]
MLRAIVRQFFVKHRIEPCAIVAVVSGGSDSTALLLSLAELRNDGFTVTCAHVNHHLRGAESDDDEAFVRALCEQLDVPLHVADGTLDDAGVRERGIEAAAREVRYARLRDIRERTDARFVATAHQKNDQAETVLMRLLTGGGIAALRGIHPIRDDGFVRPLLDATRDEIEAFLRERGITARHDRSNDDPRFLRNRVRVIVRELGAADNLAALAEQARMQWPILERAIDDAERAHVDVREDEARFRSWPDDAWVRQALLHRHIHRLDTDARDVSAADLTRIAAEVEHVSRMSITRSLELVRRGGELVLRRVPEATPEFEVAVAPEAPAFIPELGVTVHVARSEEPRHQAFRLPDGATPAFTVRNRRRGDRFQPLGLPSPKKLKDFLIDRKIAADVRDRIPLLVWNDEIVWVAGVEISERFKVTDAPGALYEVWLEGS